MPHSYEMPSVLPVAFMDLVLQLPLAVMGAGRRQMASLMMPTAIQELDISMTQSNQPGQEYRIVARAPSSPSKSLADFFIDSWHADHPEPVVKLAGLQFTPVNDGTEGSPQGPRSLCCKVE